MGANLQNRGANGRFASVSDVFKKEVVHSCPSCYLREVKVIESRRSSNHIRRRRECLSCNHRWSTMEISKELYDRLVA
jgi:DNA-directed RNA polymerase subunit M/transcription elongation factor TFIIS